MHSHSLRALLGLVAVVAVSAAPASSTRENRRHGICQQLDVPIRASAENSIFNLTRIDDDITARSWAVVEDTRTTLRGAERIIKNVTVSGVYNIHAQLCLPHTTGKSDVVQIATHGGHYDSRYWDAELEPEKHSWVNAALRAGYPILTYDRLGAGKSDHPDAYEVVQAGLELEILRRLTEMTRKGRFHRAMGREPGGPLQVIHVGHSFGSFLTSAFIATYPDLSDAAVITGYVATELLGSVGYSPWSVKYATDRSPGYVLAQKSGIQNVFFAGDPSTAFTPKLLDYGNRIKQPVPVGELASGYKLVGLPAFNYTGPIHFMLAEFDFFICRGDCNGVANRTQLELSYPKAAALEVDIQPNTGHAFPLHNNASAGFQVSFDFLQRHGF